MDTKTRNQLEDDLGDIVAFERQAMEALRANDLISVDLLVRSINNISATILNEYDLPMGDDIKPCVEIVYHSEDRTEYGATLKQGSVLTIYATPDDPDSAVEGEAKLLRFCPERISVADRELWLVRFVGDSVGKAYHRYILINQTKKATK